MKILALDIGDVWTGTALSDVLGMFARPHKTTPTKDLNPFLQNLFTQESITTVIIGYPKTMHGTESEQTKKIIAQKNDLAQKFSNITWILWDERLSSKRAEMKKKGIKKEDKIHAHSVAAAFILSSYLDHQAFQKTLSDI